MTPQEIFEYKLNWKTTYLVDVHSDLREQAVLWCKTHVPKHQWNESAFTDVYQHTYSFERQKDFYEFSALFGD